ncbi:PAS domain S-box protein [Ammoniphilus sp. YIM 78166]|uniref:SpoIIE family protein phosphatase n=1 Tax=Ammoniphilus sp. YIM 78166 TaxID=1644106 RepID=UPI0010702EC1|nr:PAS domain S-box protein [Ammoniphilus sp. YIM 78166]
MALFLENEEQVQALFKAIPDIIIVKDSNGGWAWANQVAICMFQLQDVDYRGKSNFELAQYTWIKELLISSDVTDEQAWQEKKSFRFEKNFRAPDGTTQIFDILKVPTFYEDGSKKALIVIGRDITERKKVEEKLHLNAKILEASNDGIMITDAHNTIIYVNPAFTRLTGYGLEEVLGLNPSIISSGIQDDRFYHQMWEEIFSKGMWQGEIWNKRKSGELFLESLSINVIRNDQGKISHYVAVFRDITIREKLKKDVVLTGEIQRKFLPLDYESDWLEMKSIYKPLHYVSGDFFDYVFDKRNNRLILSLFDLMGHGLATALQISCLKVLFRQIATRELSLEEKMAWMNKEAIQYFTDETFAAAILVEVNPVERQLTYCSGGINHFIMATKKKTVVTAPGSFIGLMEDESYEQYMIDYQPGTQFYFLTDGLYENLIEEIDDHRNFDETFLYLREISNGPMNRDDASAICMNFK